MSAREIIKNIYFYVFAAVGLIFMLIGLVQLIQLGLRSYVFTQADQYPTYPASATNPDGSKYQGPSEEEMAKYQEQQRTSDRQRTATSGLAFVIVGTPLFLFHFRIIKRDLRA